MARRRKSQTGAATAQPKHEKTPDGQIGSSDPELVT